jgi:hypothetical protein
LTPATLAVAKLPGPINAAVTNRRGPNFLIAGSGLVEC